MLKIGEFSKIAKTTIKALRYYDEVNLLKPKFVDDNGYRYYDIEQLNDLIMVVELRNLDFSIENIKNVMSSNDKKSMLEKQLAYLENEFNKKQKQISLIKNYIKKAEKGDFMEKYEAKEIVVPAEKVYFRHGKIDTMGDLFNFVLSAGNECRNANQNLKCKNYCYVTYTAKEYKENDIELEYVEAVTEFGQETDNIKFRMDPEITAISVQHQGSYENLAKAYSFALNYVKAKGYTIAGPIREVYLHGCWDTENEVDYLTEIQIPISQ